MASAAVLEILPEAGALAPTTHLAEDLKADSVDLIEIVACVERDLDMTIDEDLIYDIETVGDLGELIDKLRAS
jgi:acyl carrier protein